VTDRSSSGAPGAPDSPILAPAKPALAGLGWRRPSLGEASPLERGLCPRNRVLGEVSEGAVEAPSEEKNEATIAHAS
jgi:hypothetical protein